MPAPNAIDEMAPEIGDHRVVVEQRVVDVDEVDELGEGGTLGVN